MNNTILRFRPLCLWTYDNCDFYVCAFPLKWTLQMMNQPHDCFHHCQLQRWHLHHDRKCDELSISPCICMHTHAHMLWVTVMYSAVGHIWRRLHITVRLRKTWSPWVNQCFVVFHLSQSSQSNFALELIRKKDAKEMKPFQQFSKTL